ncbi:unnamed protein product [Fusarium graminearum]|nr:unnamed protein product [Fusarium graminearum]
MPQYPPHPHQQHPHHPQHPQQMVYAHPHQVPHPQYMAQYPHPQMQQYPYHPWPPHPHMAQAPHQYVSPYMGPHVVGYAPQPGYAPHPGNVPQAARGQHPGHVPQQGNAPPQPGNIPQAGRGQQPGRGPRPANAPPQPVPAPPAGPVSQPGAASQPRNVPQAGNAGQPGNVPPQSPLFTPVGTPRWSPTPTPAPQSVASTPARQSASPTPVPESTASTPAPETVPSTPAPESVASTPAPESVASTPAPEPSSSRTTRTSDMGPPPKKKRGPKPKPLSERKPLRTTPIVRKENSYSKQKRKEVITWMVHHRVSRLGEMVPPSAQDAENHFKIPRSTIAGWKTAFVYGLEAIKQLLDQSQPYKVILGARNIQRAQKSYDELNYDRSASGVTILPLELNDLKGVKSFADQTLEKLGQGKIDYLLLNAGLGGVSADEPGPNGSKWCEPHVVNHLSQYYLVHLLREKLVESKSRIVFVSSGAVRRVSDPSKLDEELKAGSGADAGTTYCNTKFTGLLGAHWWRRQLADTNDVVAVSPGLIPGTGLAKKMGIQSSMPDAKSIPEGASSVLAALTRSDFPEDRDRIFLTSWGEWWEKAMIEKSTDKALQDKWCPSKEEIERDAGIST